MIKDVLKNILKPGGKPSYLFRFLKYPTFNSYVHKIISKNVQSEHNVLDVGSRKFPYIKHLKCKKITGIDIPSESEGELGWNDKIINQIRSDHLKLYYANAEELPFDNNTFNIVVLIEVLEHIERDKLAIKEISRVLKKDGLLILTTPNGLHVENLNPYHLRHYLPQQLKEILDTHFDNVKLFTKFPYIKLHVKQCTYKLIKRFLYINLNKIVNLTSCFTDKYSGYTIFAFCRNPKIQTKISQKVQRKEIVCPKCKGKLKINKNNIRCINCGRTYELIHGIPALLTKIPHHQKKD